VKEDLFTGTPVWATRQKNMLILKIKDLANVDPENKGLMVRNRPTSQNRDVGHQFSAKKAERRSFWLRLRGNLFCLYSFSLSNLREIKRIAIDLCFV
jgi:hypothetical protein